MKDDIELFNALEAGKRTRYVRKLADLDRSDLSALAGISKASLSYYENASLSKLNMKAAIKIVKALKKKGVICSPEWLMTGEGETPKVENINYVLNEEPVDIKGKEQRLFLSQPDSVIVKIDNDSFAPYLKHGDEVGGIWIAASSLATEEICIVHVYNKIEVRNVGKIDTSDQPIFDLRYDKFIPNINSPFELKAVTLERVAPITRLWR